MAKAIDKSYLLKQMKGYDSTIASKKYVAIESGKSLISSTDLAQIGTNKTNVTNLTNKVGSIPSGSSATTIVAYAQEVANAAKAAATYDDSSVKADIKSNKDAITVLNGTSSVSGSVAKTVNDAINTFATKVSDDKTINTFKELIDYAASHTSEYSTLSGTVQSNTNAISTINGTGAGSIAKSLSDAKAYTDTQISSLKSEVSVTFETTDIDFTTEWSA